MRIGNKLFPYPTLNQNQDLSAYNKTSSFEVLLTTEEGSLIKHDEQILLKNIHFKLNNAQLEELYYDEKIKCGLIVECSSSLYRESFLIDDIPVDISIPLENLKDVVNISAYMYVADRIEGFFNKDFNEDYSEYKFDLEKYNIVAIDDGFKFRIDIDDEGDNKASSIFTIILSDSKDKVVHYENGTNKIKLYLSVDYYKEYSSLKTVAEANNVVFGILLVPVLSECFDEIKIRFEDVDDIEEIIEEKKWFKSICTSYENVSGLKLTIDDFKESNSFVLAQMLLNDGTCKGLQDFSDILFNGNQGGEEDEE